MLERFAARSEARSSRQARRDLRTAVSALQAEKWLARLDVFGPALLVPTLLRDGGTPQGAQRASGLVAATLRPRGDGATPRIVFVGGVADPAITSIRVTVDTGAELSRIDLSPVAVPGRTRSNRFAVLVGAGVDEEDTPPGVAPQDFDFGAPTSAVIAIEGFVDAKPVSFESFSIPFR